MYFWYVIAYTIYQLLKSEAGFIEKKSGNGKAFFYTGFREFEGLICVRYSYELDMMEDLGL